MAIRNLCPRCGLAGADVYDSREESTGRRRRRRCRSCAHVWSTVEVSIEVARAVRKLGRNFISIQQNMLEIQASLDILVSKVPGAKDDFDESEDAVTDWADVGK